MGNETTMAKARGVLELDTIKLLNAKVDALTNLVSRTQINSIESANVVCESCGGSHSYSQCNLSANEDVNYLQGGFNQRMGLNSNTYNPQWRNHPGFSWSNPSSQLNPPYNPNTKPQNPPGFSMKQNFNPTNSKPTLDNLMEQFVNQQMSINKQNEEQFKQLHSKLDQLATHNRILETQIAQQASTSNTKPLGKLPSQPEYVQKESCQAITLRSGKEVEEDTNKKKRVVVVDDDDGVEVEEVDVSTKQNNEKERKGTKGVDKTLTKEDEPKVDIKALPFPQRFIRRNLDKQFGKFLDYLKEITITIPFLDAIRDMPAWGKFLKDIISHKSKLEDYGLVSLVEESKAMYSKTPPKLKDLGSFTVPCVIGGTHFDKALCDIGASVSLMPYSIYKKLDLDELKPTNMCLSMADKSITYPLGILENVSTKVVKFVIPADFVVLEMEEDIEIPILFGRAFLRTA